MEGAAVLDRDPARDPAAVPLRLVRAARSSFALAVLIGASAGSSGAQGIAPTLTVTGATLGVGQTAEVSVLLDHDIGDDALGWSYGLCHPLGAFTLESVGLGADGSICNGGSEPDFVDLQIFPDGWTVGVVINLIGTEVLPPGTGQEIGLATYTANTEGAHTFCTCTGLGTPPYDVVIVYSGASLVPAQNCGTVEVLPDPIPEFRRGDTNLDGFVDLADPIVTLEYLFSGGPAPACVETADSDDDGAVDIADPIGLLEHLFAMGPPPAAPYPECGYDLSYDCAVGGGCP